MDMETAVRTRYSDSANAVEPALCCPTTYNAEFLKAIPREIVEKDYGCGDPTEYCRPGEIVLDLGSGGGKACYILSQKVGPEGRVIGVDMNDDMLALARKYQDEIAEKIGHANVEFRKGRIQDLRVNMDLVDAWLARNPIDSAARLAEFEAYRAKIAVESPLVADESVDVIVSNCVLNLVRSEDKEQLFKEMYRVLRNGGRAVISDIVSDEDAPEAMRNDPELWSGCISGAFREDLFLAAFEEAGFHGVEILKFDATPWQTVGGIEFRSMTVSASKGKVGPCLEQNQAVIYKGPFSAVHDDDHHRFPRGVRVAVCGKTFRLLRDGPYAEQFVFISPREEVPESEAGEFDCSRSPVRDPAETKGAVLSDANSAGTSCCATEGGCC